MGDLQDPGQNQYIESKQTLIIIISFITTSLLLELIEMKVLTS